jgi:hypothetical protein
MKKKIFIVVYFFFFFSFFLFIFELFIEKSKNKFIPIDIYSKYLELNKKEKTVPVIVTAEYYSATNRKFSEAAKNLNIFPLTFVPNTKTIYCSEGENYAIYKSDKFGYRNLNNDYDLQKINFLFVGDSFVHGACVRNEHTISGIFKSINLNSLNFSYGGWGAREYLAILSELKHAFSGNEQKIPIPENLVIFITLANDWAILKTEEHEIINKYFENNIFHQDIFNENSNYNRKISSLLNFSLKEYSQQKLEEKNTKIIWLNLFKFKNTRKALKKLIYLTQYNSYDQVIHKKSKQLLLTIPLINKIFDKGIEICELKQCNVFVATIPSMEDILHDKKNFKAPHWYFNNLIKEISEKKNINFIDGYEFMTSEKINKKNCFPPNGPHYSIYCYEKFSENLIKQLKNKKQNLY